MLAEYTKQLNEIAQSLNRMPPWWQNQWILATFSTTLGFLGGMLGQVFYHWLNALPALALPLPLPTGYAQWSKLRLVRRILYEDIVDVFLMLAALKKRTNPSLQEYQRVLKEHPSTEVYLRTNNDLYILLRERLAAENIYGLYRAAHLAENRSDYAFDTDILLKEAAASIHDDVFHMALFKKYLPPIKYEKLVETVRIHYSANR